ncbi:MAG: UPF0262 family protein [Rhodospirillales bacterium]|nr:UPF0262 family protein [Rhodospirillales bacterium]
MSRENRQRLVHIQLDEKTLVRRRPEVEHERAVAIYDLIEENAFAPVGDFEGPFTLHLGIEDDRLLFDIRSEDGLPLVKVPMSVKPFQRLVKDYFMVCEHYFAAIKNQPPSKIEALDMGRRGLHNEGSELLRAALDGKIALDFDTARRLFTLLCVLHVRG